MTSPSRRQPPQVYMSRLPSSVLIEPETYGGIFCKTPFPGMLLGMVEYLNSFMAFFAKYCAYLWTRWVKLS
jgi:hypothetical protein